MSADRLGHYYVSIHNLGPVCMSFSLIVRHFLLEEIFLSIMLDGQGLHMSIRVLLREMLRSGSWN